MGRLAHDAEPPGALISSAFIGLDHIDKERRKALGAIDRFKETRHLSGEGSTIARTLAEQIGTTSPIFKLLSPDQADGVVGAIAKTVGKALDAQRDAVVSQFSLDRPDSRCRGSSRLCTRKTGTCATS